MILQKLRHILRPSSPVSSALHFKLGNNDRQVVTPTIRTRNTFCRSAKCFCNNQMDSLQKLLIKALASLSLSPSPLELNNWIAYWLIFSSSSSLLVPQVVHGAFIEPAHRIRKRSINQQLRISLVYDLSVYRLDDDKFALVNVSEMLCCWLADGDWRMAQHYADDKRD